MQEYVRIAKEIALEAGKIMTTYFAAGSAYTLKLDRSPVTQADLQIQDLVTKRLTNAYPTHQLLGEEGNVVHESEYTWVFDPIDGTAAFIRGVPTNVFSLALVKNGVPVVGVVYDPYMQRMYECVQGEPAYCNGEKIMTSPQTILAGSYIETDGHKGFKNLGFFEEALREKVRFLSYSSTVYAHMLVATGQLQGVIFPKGNPWDCAAAKVIVEGAGGVTSDLHGNDQRYDEVTQGFVSSGNAEYHANLLNLIAPSVN